MRKARPVTIYDQHGRPVARQDGRGVMMRRWDGAKSHRLNAGRYADATDAHINTPLASDLETLRMRTVYETANNPYLYGVVETHCGDINGINGPRLQCMTPDESDQNFADWIENGWAEWFANCDISGRLSGPDMMAQWDRLLWTHGEFVGVKMSDPDIAGRRVRLKIANIDPRRLGSPFGRGDGAMRAQGITRDRFGRPVSYSIRNRIDDLGVGEMPDDYAEVDAAFVIHGYHAVEPGQIRGYPIGAAALEPIGSMREGDRAVLEAMKQAALSGIFMETDDPDQKSDFDVDEQTAEEWEPGMSNWVPPMWKARMLSPEQPQQNYIEYRAEQHRSIGRPVGMPGMIVRLDASGHNYSSARFDSKNYERSVRAHRKWKERVALFPIFRSYLAEALLVSNRRQPRGVRYRWMWDAFQHVDPLKEAAAAAISLSQGIVSRTQCAANFGDGDIDATFLEIAREQKRMQELGIAVNTGSVTTSISVQTQEPGQ